MINDKMNLADDLQVHLQEIEGVKVMIFATTNGARTSNSINIVGEEVERLIEFVKKMGGVSDE